MRALQKGDSGASNVVHTQRRRVACRVSGIAIKLNKILCTYGYISRYKNLCTYGYIYRYTICVYLCIYIYTYIYIHIYIYIYILSTFPRNHFFAIFWLIAQNACKMSSLYFMHSIFCNNFLFCILHFAFCILCLPYCIFYKQIHKTLYNYYILLFITIYTYT